MSQASLFDAQDEAPATANISALLDRVLSYACDIDHALELMAALGWQINQIGPGGHFVMLDGPMGDCLTSRYHHEPHVVHRRYTACANFSGLYGALMLAIMQAVMRSKKLPAEVEHFKTTSKLLAA